MTKTWTCLALLLVAAALARGATVLIPTNAVWRYLDGGSDEGTAWRALGFDDSQWPDGPAELGYGDTVEGRPEATLLDPGPNPNNKPITCYFRHTFMVSGAAGLTNLRGRFLRDDGGLVYLNGTEVIRSLMPSGDITFTTLASQPGSSGDDESTFFPFNIDGRLLREGLNVVAAEVHQLAASSSDLSFAFELSVLTNAPTPPPGSTEALVVPESLAERDVAWGAGTLRASSFRAQEIYGAVHFPAVPMYITELRFRPDATYGRAFNTVIGNIQINLSATTRQPDGLSLTFADNVGEDDVMVFSGALGIASEFAGPAAGPKNFDIAIVLETPFLYNPESGNLLVDIRNFSGSTASPLSGEGVLTDSASRLTGSTSSLTGTRDSGIDALMVIYSATNGPPPPPRPAKLTRGPYLQCGTTTNMVVCWRTERATNSIVRFGRTPANLPWSVQNDAALRDHFVTLTNLAPDTKYFYSIGATATNLAGGPEYCFTTAPGRAKPTRIWAIGDAGTANQVPGSAILQDPWAVRDAYTAFTGARETDVWLILGDNAYLSGFDSEYQTNFFDTYPALLRCNAVWPTIGNHEVNSIDGDAPDYLNMFVLPRNGEAGGVPSGDEHYYSFDYGNIHFVCLDSEVRRGLPGGAMLTWLEQDLAANTNDWLIAFWHSPPYNFGTHNSDSPFDTGGHLVQMRENAVPILEAHGVDLVLCGHSHAYERSFLLDGHYGYSSSFSPTMALDSGSGQPEDSGPYRKNGLGPTGHEGGVYVVAGSSGWVTGELVPTKHPAIFAKIRQLGSMVIDVDGQRLDAKFLRENGAIDDSFTILKGAAPEPLKFATFRIHNGVMTAQFKTEASHEYRVQRTSRLKDPQWSDASERIVATGATTQWSAPVPPDGQQLFFRVVKVE